MQSNQQKIQLSAISGAYVSLNHLLNQRFFAKDLALFSKRKIHSTLSGQYISSFRGRGIDFTEVRHYQPGDDIRLIDWRVTARTQKTHTKVFQEEKERPVFIVVDQSTTMFFGSKIAFKSVIAAQIAAILSWAALQHGDRVGGLVFSHNNYSEIKPKRSKHTVLTLLRLIHQYNNQLNKENYSAKQPNHNYLANALEHIRRTAKPGSAIFIISDFQMLDNAAKHQLIQLTKHNDIIGLYLFDELEKSMPTSGHYAVTNGSSRLTIHANKKLSSQYERIFNQKLNELTNTLGKIRIPLIQIATNDNIVNTLHTNFGRARR